MHPISPEVKQVMSFANDVSKEYGLPTPYIVGGYVRGLYLGEEAFDDDLDITTNSGPNSLFLGVLYANKKNCNIQIFNERHASIYNAGRKIDFSSGFISDNLPVGTPDELKEPMSRDFTVDCIHIRCDDFSIFDLSGRGIRDVKNRHLDTIIDPEHTFADDPKRVFRAIYLSSKHNFSISDRIIECCKEIDIEDFRKENARFITSIVDKAFGYSKEKTLENIYKLSLDFKIPIFGEFRNYLVDTGKIKEYLGASNE